MSEKIFIQLNRIVKREEFISLRDQLKHESKDIILLPADLKLIYPAVHWIPCSVCLPDNERVVLVTLKYADADDDYEVAVGEYWKGKGEWGLYSERVIAWAELPSPYKEKEE